MSIDNTAHLILNRNEDENIESRVNGYYVHLRDMKAMANLWLMRDEIVKSLTNDPDYRQEVYALRRKIEALEKE